MESSSQWPSYAASTNSQEHYPPQPSVAGTACLLGSIALAYAQYGSQATATEMATVVADLVGIGFLLSLLFDVGQGLRNLFRTDILCILAVYALTLAEFLFPQPNFVEKATIEQTTLAIDIVLLGMASLVIGRHLVRHKPTSSSWLVLTDLSSKALFRVFLIASALGYGHKLISVQFNLMTMIDAMMAPRFSQPWSRGRLGGISSLFIELALMTYIIPPLAAVIWNQRRAFSTVQLSVVIAIFSLTMFQGFASGTRNIFISYVATFIMGYVLTIRKNTFANTIVPVFIASFICVYGSYHMLEFRNIGLGNYIEDKVYAQEKDESDTFAVDYNLASIGWVAEAMPESFPFLGKEIAVWALVKPIPRVFWSGKPEGLSVSIEEIAGADGWTVAATYLGESYMMAGMAGVVGTSMLFGAIAAWWNQMAMRQQSDYALVVYALGFFAAGITMRSMFWFTTTILPVVALIALRKVGPFK